MLNKLLRQNISIPQLAGYALAALVGMSIIFSVFRFSIDVKPLFSVNTGLFKHEFMTINKKVSVLTTINSDRSVFSKKEIENIEKQDFVKSVSFFKSCRYSVKAYTIPSGSIPAFSTEMFFESVPDRLLDNAWPEYKDSADKFIPIIIPRDYLNLYNFGFAGSRGLPQISESIVKEVSFRVQIAGKGKYENFTGRIVGFSDYINTILVPDEFMDWANNNFGTSENADKVSRIIVEVKNPADPHIAEFFGDKNYMISENKGEQGKLSYFLKMLIVIVLAVGCLIMLPAIGLMLLSINLLVYKNQKTLGNLIMLGYKRSNLTKPYSLLVLFLNVGVAVLSFAISLFARSLYMEKLKVLDIKSESGLIATLIFVIAFVAIVTAFNIWWIRNKINKITPPVMG